MISALDNITFDHVDLNYVKEDMTTGTCYSTMNMVVNTMDDKILYIG